MARLVDTHEVWPESSREVVFSGMVADLVETHLTTPSGEQLRRQWVHHPGSVAVIALDDSDRIAVVHQFRSPVQMRLVEAPAGLLDVGGEDPLHAAQRELAEEVGLAADDWRVLADVFASPGGSDERLRVYLAQDLHDAPAPDGFEREGEEVDMGLTWLPLDEVVDLVRAGQVENIALVTGVLALAFALVTDGVDDLRPGDAEWPANERATA